MSKNHRIEQARSEEAEAEPCMLDDLKVNTHTEVRASTRLVDTIKRAQPAQAGRRDVGG